MKANFGTFTNGASDCGGDIDTGLSTVYAFIPAITGSSAPAEGVAVNESFPLASGTVTIVTKAGVDGIWFALGK